MRRAHFFLAYSIPLTISFPRCFLEVCAAEQFSEHRYTDQLSGRGGQHSMGDFIDITQFSVAVSCIGLFFIISIFGIKPSKSWESSSSLKKALLLIFGLIFQVPVVITIISKPDVVINTLSTKPWTWKNLLINYLVITGIGIVAFVISLFTGRYDASK